MPGDEDHRAGEVERGHEDAVGPEAADHPGDDHGAEEAADDVHAALTSRRPASGPSRYGGPADGAHDHGLEQAALGVAADRVEGEEHGEHGAEEERPNIESPSRVAPARAFASRMPLPSKGVRPSKTSSTPQA
jgi:hypothetical protein